MKRKIISEYTASVIFSSIEGIVKLNKYFLADILGRVKTWENETSKIGDVFVRWCPGLDPYIDYINNYGKSMALISRERKKNEKFAQFVDTERYDRSSLKDLLIVPIQRFPRYALLLGDLANVASSLGY